MSDGVFDEEVARGYDAAVARMFDPAVLEPTVTVLEELSKGGRVLEFAIGTGRVALPLAQRGVAVSGIELSSAMVKQLRAKPGGAELEVVIGDMTSSRIDGAFSLVFLVFNTIGNLLSQDEQVACFANAAEHLAPGGRFVIEVEVPALRRLPIGERYVPIGVAGGYAGMDEYDTVSQRLHSHHVSVHGDGTGSVFVTPQRYVWPSELDLMARIAGLRLEHRWSGWDRAPFTAESTAHVSVWVKESVQPGG